MNNERVPSSENSEPVSSNDIGAKVLNLEKRDLKAEFDSQLEDSKKIRDAFAGITGNSDFLIGTPYAHENEEEFSGNAASLYMLVKFKKDGEDKTELVKIGWGEFSKQVFTKDVKSKHSDYVPEYKDGKYFGYKAQYEVLRSLPFDVYCVSQRESYLVDEETQRDMLFNPEKYLREHAKFVAKDGEVTLATRIKPTVKKLEYDIVPISEEEAVRSVEQMRELYSETIDKLSKTNEG